MYQSHQEGTRRGINDLLVSDELLAISNDIQADSGNRSSDDRFIQLPVPYISAKHVLAGVWQAGEMVWKGSGQILTPGTTDFVFVPAFNAERQQVIPTQLSAQQPSTLPFGRITGQVKLIQSVARAWDIDDSELARLLGYQNPAHVRDVLKGRRTFTGTEDRFDRARIMYKIHSTLARLFVDTAQEATWIRSPNSGLQNISPLNYMLNRRIPGMVAVLQYVELDVALRR